MIKTINDVAVNYIDYGEGHNTIVLLHGWGQNIEMMKPVGDRFKKNSRIIIVDLPGFGMSGEPTYIWTLNDYVECVKELLDKLEIENPILAGHSFGGKISLLYASKYKVEKLVLFGAPCIRIQEKLPLHIKALKTLKKIPKLNFEMWETLKEVEIPEGVSFIDDYAFHKDTSFSFM